MNQLYKKWCESDVLSENDRNELLAISNDEKEIEERFYKSLEFGTGGLRGILGIGTNRMNVYTVRQATQGVADYINGENGGKEKGYVIAYDTRHFSDVFAKEAAKVLCGNGIKTYLFNRPVPTPELSFAIRELNAFGGIVITASHNPKEYNGYKVYDDTGCQITIEAADKIYSFIQNTDVFTGVKSGNEDLIITVDNSVEENYINAIYDCKINDVSKIADNFKVVYTPLHGTGKIPVEKILKKSGINFLEVEEQCIPDGDFPTVKSPNPENKEALEMGINLAKQNSCELVIGTDPDADRVGVAIRTKSGEYAPLSGNQIGILLLNYILEHKELPENPIVVKTIVTTYLANKMAKAHNVDVVDVLTGFKFIGEQIRNFELSGNKTYLFGFEESCGYLVGTYSRDKDSVGAVMLISEMAVFYNSKGLTLFDVLNGIYEKYGWYEEKLQSVTMPGKDGAEKIQAVVQDIRTNCREFLEGEKVSEFIDYQNDETGLPKSNVIKITLENGSSFVIRPSGTEPKVKVYYFAHCKCEPGAKEKLANIEAKVNAILNKYN